MTTTPDVSIIVPTRDRWPLLSRNALSAALGQRDVEFELLVVDDGSSDQTPAELARLAERDPRVRTLRQDRPQGVATARNAGVAAARAPLVAFLDDDDLWSTTKLAAQLDVMSRTGADWSYTGAVAVTESGTVLYEYYFPEPEAVAQQLLESAVIPGGASNVVARTELVRELGGFDGTFLHLEDWDLWLRLAEVSTPAALHEVHVAVLFHPGNKHAIHDQAGELDRLVRKHAATTPARPMAVHRHGHARWVAGQHSRAGLSRRAAWLYVRSAVRHRSASDLGRAVDALFGKRISRALAAREPQQPVAPPAWLQGRPSVDG
jgi:GT2 family glycosyltransferase